MMTRVRKSASDLAASNGPVTLRVAGRDAHTLASLDPGESEHRPRIEILSSDPELAQGVNTAGALGFDVAIRFHNLEDTDWSAVEQCLDRFLHHQTTAARLEPFASMVASWLARKPRSLLQWEHPDPPDTSPVDDNRELTTAGFTQRLFSSPSRCSTCPVYTLCGGLMVFRGLDQCEGLIALLDGFQRALVALTRDYGDIVGKSKGRSGRPPKDLSILVSYKCVNNCIFCAPAQHRKTGAREDPEEINRTIRSAAKNGVVGVCLSGAGEPTLSPNLLGYVKEAKAAGIQSVTVFTNGHKMTEKTLASLKEAGVNGFLVSVHGLDSVHDEVCGRTGAFREAWHALELIVAAGLFVRVNTCMVRPNLDQLPRLVDRVAQAGRTKHSLTIPEWSGSSLHHRDRMAAYEEISGALHCVKNVPGLELVNTPACIGPADLYRVLASPVFYMDVDGLRVLDSDAVHNRFPQTCTSLPCPRIRECCGVDRKYLSFNGEEEFAQVPETR